MKEYKKWTMLLGRFQVPEPHKGHKMLIKTLLDEDKNVLIVLRKEDGTDKNPYTLKQRKEAFEKIYFKEIKEGRIKIVEFYDVIEIAYGRTPGWNIKEIKVPDNIKKISATNIRKQQNEGNIYVNCTCGKQFETKGLPTGEFYCSYCQKAYKRYYNPNTDNYEIF